MKMDSPSYTDIKKFYEVNLAKVDRDYPLTEIRMSDREDILDRVISNDRLLAILSERDRQILALELELSGVKRKLKNIASLFGAAKDCFEAEGNAS